MTAGDGQLDLLALLPTREEEHPTPPRLTTSPARGFAARLAAFAEWKQRYGNFDCIRVSHGWHEAMCEATGPVDRCQGTLLAANYGCDCSERDCQCVGGTYSRGACLHCAWEGPVRHDGGEAVCDALDHAHPDWRTSPVVAPLRHDATPARTRRWRAEVDTLYGDRPDGHPIITDRPPPGTRAVADRSPWGGYDVAACAVRTPTASS